MPGEGGEFETVPSVPGTFRRAVASRRSPTRRSSPRRSPTRRSSPNRASPAARKLQYKKEKYAALVREIRATLPPRQAEAMIARAKESVRYLK